LPCAETESEALTAYDKLWKEFGKAIKMGIVEDSSNRNRLAKLLRVFTSKSPDKLVSLEKYVARMKPDQKHIYFIAGALSDHSNSRLGLHSTANQLCASKSTWSPLVDNI